MKGATTVSGVQARPALTLSFFTLGFAVLLLLLGWIFLKPGIIMGGYYQPDILSITHSIVLGWLGSVFIGAAYQLGPVLARNSLQWPWLGWMHLVFHIAGISMMIPGFASGDFHWVMAGGSLVSLGFIAFIIAQVATAIRYWRADAIGCGLVMAWFWLAVTLGLGLYMAWARITGIEAAPSPWLRVHALIGMLGFFLTVFNAVSLRLVPMFAVTAEQSPSRVWISLLTTQTGLQFIAPAILLPYGFLKWVAVVLVIGGQLLFIWEIFEQFRRRHRRLDAPLRWFSMAFAWLISAFVLFVLLVMRPVEGIGDSNGENALVLVSAIFLLGSLTTAILAMSFKIIPFLIWQAAYARHLGRYRTPMLECLVSRPLLLGSSVATTIGLIALITALAFQSPEAIRYSSLSFGAGVAAVILNSLQAASHLWRPRLEPLPSISK